MDKKCGTRLCAGALGLALGITCGLSMLLLAWAGWLWGYGTALIDHYALYFHGYAATLVGGLWGGLWGLIKGFIFGLVIAWIYNCISCCCRCACCKGSESGSCSK